MFWDDDVFEELERMRRRIDSLMRKMMSGFPEIEVQSFPVDVSETENEVIVRADLPGFSKEDIRVNVGEDYVEIAAEHKEKREERKERFYRSERRVGKVYRRIQLPVPVDYEKAKAKIENGVLTITVPKKEKAKKEVEIE